MEGGISYCRDGSKREEVLLKRKKKKKEFFKSV